MTDSKSGFLTPPRARGDDDQLRRVGIELEVAGLKPEQMAAAVVEEAGGRVERESSFISVVRDTELGDFRVELDADLLKSRSYQQQLKELGIDIGQGERRENIESVLSKVAGLVVPLELVGPPVPWPELERLDRIRKNLHDAGARGTLSSPLYAFGMHMNIEVASLEPDHLLAMLRAFLICYDWLLDRSDIDLTRRVSPYILPYPEDYLAHVLAADYRPDMNTLIDDFLKFTPTRNRPLDLLPLLAHIDKKRVMAAPVEKNLIKPRPAWHYRLPNCLIDQADWSLATPWNDWIEIERLADDPERLERLRARRLAQSSGLMRWLAERWRKLFS